MAPVETGLGWGFINIKGDLVIKPKFANAWSFDKEVGLARVRIGKRSPGGKSMYIDKDGNLISLDVAKTYFNQLRKNK